MGEISNIKIIEVKHKEDFEIKWNSDTHKLTLNAEIGK